MASSPKPEDKKSKPAKPKYWIIRDTREQKGWDFLPDDLCHGVTDDKLDIGDYSIKGLQDRFIVERKRNTSELAQNLFDDGRFFRELEKLNLIAEPYLILEFEMEEVLSYPLNSGVPKSMQYKIKVNGELLLLKIHEMQIKFPNIRIWFVGPNGRRVVKSLMKRMVSKYAKKD